MWDSPLYAVNMFYYYWLIKKLPKTMAGQNIARWEIQARDRGRKMAELEKHHVSLTKKQEVTNHEPMVKYKIIEIS